MKARISQSSVILTKYRAVRAYPYRSPLDMRFHITARARGIKLLLLLGKVVKV
jgi:hypothetical protein